MKNSILVLLTLALSILGYTSVQAQEVEVDGFVRNYTGLLLNNGNYSILQNTLDLQLSHKRENISFMANPFVYQYPGAGSGLDDYFDFRELYIDFYTDKLDVRVGKQQIIWGQADGVFITDVVSPLNLTEFLLWDFNEIRMGVNAVKATYYPHDDHDLEVVWIPSFTPSILPSEGSIWRPSVAFPVAPTLDYSKKDIASNVENSELFLRYSLSKSAFDLQLIGASTWDDIASNHVTREMDSTMTLTGLTITPEHHRLLLGGMNFSASLGDFVLRGEAAYYDGKHFQTNDPTAAGALVEKGYLNYVAGLDRSIDGWKLSTQFIQKVILDYDEMMMEDEVENLMTFMVNKTFLRDQIRLELFSYVGLNNEDALLKLRAFYFPYDGVGIELGTNLFMGETGTFGQYNNNNMLYTRVKYSF
jgi:hypothetical protein